MLQMDANANPVDDETKSKCVDIEKVKIVFDNEIYAHRILREIRLLRLLRGHKNIVKLKTIMRPSDPKSFNDLNFVTEYCT